MSFPRYPEYKPSGVEWLGEVPVHWDISPLKHLVDLRSGGTPSKDNIDYWDGDVPWASAKDLKVDKLASTGDCITQYAVDSGAANLVPKGAILVVVRGMILAKTFPVTETLRPMAINQDIKAVIPRERLSGPFLAWLLRGTADESLLRLDEAGHGTKALRMESWTSIKLPVPTVHEQVAIAAFLDRETTKIDALIAEQEKLIALLAEKRQATISHAVTKGLPPRHSREIPIRHSREGGNPVHALDPRLRGGDDSVPMKDSGVAWLGEVPAHWEVKAIGYILDAIGDVDHFMPASVEKGVPYLMTGDLKELVSDVSLEECKQVSHEDYLELSKRIKGSKGDVVMARPD